MNEPTISAPPPAPSKPSNGNVTSRTNYVFIDFENVQEIDLDRIKGKPVKVVLVLGERHKSLPVALVRKLLAYAPQVSLVETGRGGKNALDLVLSHHTGEAKTSDPHGYFHIVSRDKDYDPLVGHLKDNGTLAARRAALSEIPVLMNNDERVDYVIQFLKTPGNTRPAKRKSLETHINTLFGKALSPTELADTINALVARKTLALAEGGSVVYSL